MQQPYDASELNGLIWTHSNGTLCLTLGYALGYLAGTGRQLTPALWEVIVASKNPEPTDLASVKVAIDGYYA
jgi:hypothetical protein